MARASAARSPERSSFARLLISGGLRFGGGMAWFTTPERRRRGCRLWRSTAIASSKVTELLRRLAMAEPGVELADQFFSRFRDHGARRIDCLCTGFIERVVILRRHHAANDDHDVFAALLLQRGLQFRHGGEVCGGERGDAENVNVVLDGLPRSFVGGRKQRPDIDVEADIGKGGCNDLLAAVVAVLADLCNEDARSPAFCLLEGVDQRLYLLDLIRHGGRLPLVDAGDGFDLRAVTA